MRFGRKKVEELDLEADAEAVVEEVVDAALTEGPYDLAEVEFDEFDESKVNLGSLIVTGRPGLELRLQVDEASGAVAAALLVTEDSAAELRAFASPRNGSIWDDVRRSIAADAAQQGGTATETDGPWGSELLVRVTGRDESGQTVTQDSRIAGITGPRWLLRVAFYGTAATNPDPDSLIEQAVREVIVSRGSEAMAPGEFLPLALPQGAQRT
ncbi:MAG: DUF3710 domain-containing protein [Nocardioidaceae bacterium]